MGSKADVVTRWAEDHALTVVLVPVGTLFVVIAIGLFFWPTTAIAVIGAVAAMAGVAGLALGGAGKALRWLRDRRDRRRQVPSSADMEQLQAVPSPAGQDGRGDRPEDVSSAE